MPSDAAAARIEPRASISSSISMNRGPMTLSPSRTTMSTARARAPPRQRMLLRQGCAPRSEVGDELEIDFILRCRWALRLHDPIHQEPQVLLGRDDVHAERRPVLARIRVRAIQLPRVAEPFPLEHGLQPRQYLVSAQHVAATGVLVLAGERPRPMDALTFDEQIAPRDAAVVALDVIRAFVAELRGQREPWKRRDGDAADEQLEAVRIRQRVGALAVGHRRIGCDETRPLELGHRADVPLRRQRVDRRGAVRRAEIPERRQIFETERLLELPNDERRMPLCPLSESAAGCASSTYASVSSNPCTVLSETVSLWLPEKSACTRTATYGSGAIIAVRRARLTEKLVESPCLVSRTETYPPSLMLDDREPNERTGVGTRGY